MKITDVSKYSKLSARPAGRFIVLIPFFWVLLHAANSGLTNASVSGAFFFRHLEFTTDATGAITDCRSALGTMTFDGAGRYTLNGFQTVNTLAATSLTGQGAYSIGGAGDMAIGNPQRNDLTIRAAVGTEAIVGSTTEAPDNTFDFFIAIPAATSAQLQNLFTGSYTAGTFELPLGTGAYARAALFSLNPLSNGVFNQIVGSAHALNINSSQISNFTLAGATYTLNGDGSVTANLGSINNYLSGVKTLFVSASGNIVIGGSSIAGAQDILVAVKPFAGTPVLSSWSGLFYAGGIRYDAKYPTSDSYAGSLNAIPSLSRAATFHREHQIGVTPFDSSGFLGVSLNQNGTYTNNTIEQLNLGINGGSFIQTNLASGYDPMGFALDFGIAAPALSGTGVYLNPHGILNAASLAPAGAAIAPGEFLTLFGSGLAGSSVTARAPYPITLGDVSVTVNGMAAPIYYVSANQLNILTPYSLTGSTATIQVTNNGTKSNSVVVPLSTTAPGTFSQDSSGTGPGSIVHANGQLVTSSNPAKPGETVSIYLSGLGAVNPAVSDGAAASSNPLSNTVEAVSVIVGSATATVQYAGLAPGYPGLYQINATVPGSGTGSGAVGLAVKTAEAFAEQVTIYVQ